MSAWTFPVLIFKASTTPANPQIYDRVELRLPDARVQFIEAEHSVVLENPDAVADAIRDFRRSTA
jgi:pimeloyl-ACP methyl ester carboxylesterase